MSKKYLEAGSLGSKLFLILFKTFFCHLKSFFKAIINSSSRLFLRTKLLVVSFQLAISCLTCKASLFLVNKFFCLFNDFIEFSIFLSSSQVLQAFKFSNSFIALSIFHILKSKDLVPLKTSLKGFIILFIADHIAYSAGQ
jgi:hypothetical protein